MAEYKEIEVRPHEEVLLTVLRNEQLGEEQATVMQEEVTAAAAATTGLSVVLDMSSVAMIPSLAIGALIGLLRRLQANQRRFILVGLQPGVRQVLTICRLDKLFEIYETLDDALAAIRPKA